MSIRTNCSSCGQAFQAPEAMAGKSGKCPKCGEKLQVPSLATATAQIGSAADSGNGVDVPDLPELTSWADDILSELPRAESSAVVSGTVPKPSKRKEGPSKRKFVSSLLSKVPAIAVGIFAVVISLFALLQGRLILALLCFLPGIFLTLELYRYALNRARKVRRAKREAASGSPVHKRSKRSSESTFYHVLNLKNAFGLFWSALVVLGAIAKLSGKLFGGSGSERPGYAIFTGILIFLVGAFVLVTIGILVAWVIRRVRDDVRFGSGATLPIVAVAYVFFAVVSNSVWGSLGSRYAGVIPSTPKELLSEEEIDAIVQQAELPEFPRFLFDKPGDRSLEMSFPVKDGSPGSGMSMKLCLPQGTLAPKSTPCVFIAPAGSNGLKGRTLNQISDSEYQPYVKAGMIVIAYEIDGDFSDEPSDKEFLKAYRQYLAAQGGIINAKLAMRFALEKIPEVDPGKLYAVGHSSAANVALVWAAEDDRIDRVVAYAPAMDMAGRVKEVVDELKGHTFLVPLVEELVERMSPSSHVNRIKCPTLVFHSRTDQVVPFSMTEKYVEQMKKSGVPVTLSVHDSGDHYSSMISPGISRGIQWLTTGSIDFEQEQLVKEATQLPKNQSREESEESKIASLRERAGLLASSISKTSPAKVHLQSQYNPLHLPHIKSHADLAKNTQIDFILGSDESAIERMRWSAARKRPAVLSSWAVGISVTSTNNGPIEIRHRWDFRDETGPVGEKIVEGLESKTREQDVFGEWPLHGSLIHSSPRLLVGNEKHITDTARAEGIDGVVFMDIDVSFVGLSRVKRSSIVVKVIDVNGEIPLWESEKLRSRDADVNSTKDLIASVLTQVDEIYRLEEIDEQLVNRDWVVARVRSLVGKQRSGELTQSPLGLLCELRYYQVRDLMTKEEVYKACDLLFGEGKGQDFLEGAWEKRLKAIEKIKFAPTPKVAVQSTSN